MDMAAYLFLLIQNSIHLQDINGIKKTNMTQKELYIKLARSKEILEILKDPHKPISNLKELIREEIQIAKDLLANS